jgi:hypothetical protein
MSRKPDLGSLGITKARAAEAVPFREEAVSVEVKGEPKGLTIKLTARRYAHLREWCLRQERERGGSRVTHQAALIEAFDALTGFNE